MGLHGKSKPPTQYNDTSHFHSKTRVQSHRAGRSTLHLCGGPCTRCGRHGQSPHGCGGPVRRDRSEIRAGYIRRETHTAVFRHAEPGSVQKANSYQSGDDFNRQLLDRLNRSGALYLTHAVLKGRYTLRLCIGQTWTEARHVEGAWQRIRETAQVVAAGISTPARD